MACGEVLVIVLIFFLQSLPLLVSVEAISTASLTLTNTTEAKVRCIESERNGLLRVKQSLTDPSDRLASWIGKECCIWRSVSCDVQTCNVIRLDLKDTSGNCYQKKMGYLISGISTCLGGKISPALLDLIHLEYLDLGENDFQGLSTPTFLGSLEKLQYLNLTHSSLIDLNWVSGLSSLKYLDLSYVNLSSATHWLQFFNKLPSLVTLSLQNCDLRYLPYSFPNWNMTSLSYLYISRNNFVNSVLPKWLSNATTLETLDIAINNIEGPISNVEWGKLCDLQDSYLTQNKLNGDTSRLVEGLSSCSNTTLELLGLCWKPVDRAVSKFIRTFEELKDDYLTYIEIRKCALGSKLPTWLKTQKQLRTIILSNGSISDPTPWLWTMCSQLQFLDLSDSVIGGNLPRIYTIFNNKSEAANEIGPLKHHLSGKIPNWWADLRQLHVIDLSGNNFSGGIPPLCSPPSLFWLRLSRNNLFGELPKSLSNCKSLLTLDIGENKISGIIPKWFGESILSLQKLSMTDNMIGGHIPPQLNQLFGLQILDLSHNYLTGRIPEDIGSMKQLETLDLSSNHLFGNPELCGKPLITDCSPPRKEISRNLKKKKKMKVTSISQRNLEKELSGAVLFSRLACLGFSESQGKNYSLDHALWTSTRSSAVLRIDLLWTT
ncbi:receptor-like protein EIX1 [Solanum pennellii]|uniref:Receptor-like protein EIX1 n=1 Tax=Solanum pennellii TaxID=28526 RepID=A0ABM1V1W8_SOLPN|nr:receptor-like protein EIX1 [Solanum pennellii]